MARPQSTSRMRRRDLLKLIGGVAGSSVMYQAMRPLGLAADSSYTGPLSLEGSPKGASVQNLCAIDGRILLAGEHVSYIPAWQEGAILSSVDAVSRLHTHVLTT